MVNLSEYLQGTNEVIFQQADPAQALSVPVVPLGALLIAAYEVSSRSPYALTWLNTLISAEGMMDPDLFKRLVMNNFCKFLSRRNLKISVYHQVNK